MVTPQRRHLSEAEIAEELRELPPPFYDSLEEYLLNPIKEIEMKKWYHSKTLWANVIAVVATVLVNFNIELSEEIMASEVAILGVINLILRIVTKQGLVT